MVGLILWLSNGLVSPVYDLLPDGKKRNRLVGPGMLLTGAVALTIYLVALGLTFLVANEIPAPAERVVVLGRPGTTMTAGLELTRSAAGPVASVGFGGTVVRVRFRVRRRGMAGV